MRRTVSVWLAVAAGLLAGTTSGLAFGEPGRLNREWRTLVAGHGANQQLVYRDDEVRLVDGDTIVWRRRCAPDRVPLKGFAVPGSDSYLVIFVELGWRFVLFSATGETLAEWFDREMLPKYELLRDVEAGMDMPLWPDYEKWYLDVRATEDGPCVEMLTPPGGLAVVNLRTLQPVAMTPENRWGIYQRAWPSRGLRHYLGVLGPPGSPTKPEAVIPLLTVYRGGVCLVAAERLTAVLGAEVVATIERALPDCPPMARRVLISYVLSLDQGPGALLQPTDVQAFLSRCCQAAWLPRTRADQGGDWMDRTYEHLITELTRRDHGVSARPLWHPQVPPPRGASACVWPLAKYGDEACVPLFKEWLRITPIVIAATWGLLRFAPGPTERKALFEQISGKSFGAELLMLEYALRQRDEWVRTQLPGLLRKNANQALSPRSDEVGGSWEERNYYNMVALAVHHRLPELPDVVRPYAAAGGGVGAASTTALACYGDEAAQKSLRQVLTQSPDETTNWMAYFLVLGSSPEPWALAEWQRQRAVLDSTADGRDNAIFTVVTTQLSGTVSPASEEALAPGNAGAGGSNLTLYPYMTGNGASGLVAPQKRKVP